MLIECMFFYNFCVYYIACVYKNYAEYIKTGFYALLISISFFFIIFSLLRGKQLIPRKYKVIQLKPP